MDPEAGPQLPDCIRPYSPWCTHREALAHREEAGIRANREGKEGAGLSAQAAEPLGEQGRGRASQG